MVDVSDKDVTARSARASGRVRMEASTLARILDGGMAKGDVLFSATGVTDGNMLAGVRFAKNFIETHTIVMRSHSRTVREIIAKHQDLDKF